jgi:hypothetical protein
MVRRLFWEIPKGVVNRNKRWDCDAIPGSRSLHYFDGFSNRLSTLLQVKELCCFCPYCLDDNSNLCENIAWTGRSKLHMVQGVLRDDMRDDIESMGVGEGADTEDNGLLAELLQLGDFYAIQASKPNQWKADFYIMQCEEKVHIVQKDFLDGYNVPFRKGDKVVKGKWFQPVPGRESRFVATDDAPSGYNLANSVVRIRFGLLPCEIPQGRKGGAQMYSLDTQIQAALYKSFDS